MVQAMDWAVFVGYLASGIVFATFCMRTMIPLRVTAIASNIAFILYGFFGHIYPVLVLHLVLLPMNIWRVSEMIRLVRKVEEAAKNDLSFAWLKPYMKAIDCRAGDIIFKRGDPADQMFLIGRGELLLREIDVTLRPGAILGEMALFSDQRRRTQTAVCLTDVHLMWIGEHELAQLCFQNPGMSFYLLRLITNRLIHNVTRLEQRADAVQQTPAAAVK